MDNIKKTLYFDYTLLRILPLTQWINLTFNKYFSLVRILLGFKDVPFRFGNNLVQVSTIGDLGTTISSLSDGYFEVYKIIGNNVNTIVDVGGNIGQFSNSMNFWYPDSTIHIFEPDPNTFLSLQKNTSKMDCSLYNCALSYKAGKLDFFRSDISAMSSLVQINKNQEVIKVDVDTADSILEKISQIDLFKIDVEGAELDVLKGSHETIKKSKYLLIELSFDRPKNNANTNLNVLAEVWKIAPNAEIINLGRALGGYGIVTAQDFLIRLNNI